MKAKQGNIIESVNGRRGSFDTADPEVIVEFFKGEKVAKAQQ